MEGFETYAGSQTPLGRKYAAASNVGVLGSGRLHGTAGQLGGTSRLRTRLFGSPADKCVFGFGYKDDAVAGSTGLEINILRGAADQLKLRFVAVTSSTFRIDVMRGATILEGTPEYSTGNWHYFEFEVTLHTATGAYELRRNETLVISDTGVNTADSGSNGWNAIDIDGSSGTVTALFDYFYLLDGTGAANNTFLGDSVIEGKLPSGDGATVDWTPSSGSTHHTLLADLSDVTYVATDVAGEEEFLEFPDFSAITGNIHGVMVMATMALDSLGSRTIRLKALSGATEGDGDAQVIESTSFSGFYEIFEVDPDTTSAWDVSGFNAALFGFELVS